MNAFFLWTDGDQTIHLPETIEVEKYYCGIVEMHGKLNFESGHGVFDAPLYLCSDIGQDVFVNEKKLPVLRQVNTKPNGFIQSTLDKVIWLQVRRPTISSIHLYLVDRNGEKQSFIGKGLYCTLLLIPNHYD